MSAIYKIEDGEKIIEFAADPLSFKKCLQIYKIAEKDRAVKGFKCYFISFGDKGLKELHIYRVKTKKNKPVG